MAWVSLVCGVASVAILGLAYLQLHAPPPPVVIENEGQIIVAGLVTGLLRLAGSVLAPVALGLGLWVVLRESIKTRKSVAAAGIVLALVWLSLYRLIFSQI